jgi:hypothetical protein
MKYRLLLPTAALGIAFTAPLDVYAQTALPGAAPGLMLAPSRLAPQNPPLNNSMPPLANSDAAMANLRAGLPFNSTGNLALAPALLSAPMPPPGAVRR